MSDFVGLICPQCGGKLNLQNDSVTVSCIHCGTEYIAQRESGNILLEQFARCPTCQRNDKVEKITSIVKRETEKTEGVNYQSVTYSEEIDGKTVIKTKVVPVHVTSTRQSGRAQALKAPERPSEPAMKELGWPIYRLLAIGSIAASIFGCISVFIPIFGAVPIPGLDIVFDIIILLGGIIASTYLFIVQVPKENISREVEAKKIEAENAHIKHIFQQKLSAWKRAVDRYNKVYCCERCDKVFIPGQKHSVSADELWKILYDNTNQ